MSHLPGRNVERVACGGKCCSISRDGILQAGLRVVEQVDVLGLTRRIRRLKHYRGTTDETLRIAVHRQQSQNLALERTYWHSFAATL